MSLAQIQAASAGQRWELNLGSDAAGWDPSSSEGTLSPAALSGAWGGRGSRFP